MPVLSESDLEGRDSVYLQNLGESVCHLPNKVLLNREMWTNLRSFKKITKNELEIAKNALGLPVDFITTANARFAYRCPKSGNMNLVVFDKSYNIGEKKVHAFRKIYPKLNSDRNSYQSYANELIDKVALSGALVLTKWVPVQYHPKTLIYRAALMLAHSTGKTKLVRVVHDVGELILDVLKTLVIGEIIFKAALIVGATISIALGVIAGVGLFLFAVFKRIQENPIARQALSEAIENHEALEIANIVKRNLVLSDLGSLALCTVLTPILLAQGLITVIKIAVIFNMTFVLLKKTIIGCKKIYVENKQH